MTEVRCLLGSNETEVEGKVEDWLGAQMTYSGVLSGVNHATGRLIVNVSSREIEDELIESDLCILFRLCLVRYIAGGNLKLKWDWWS
jgi:hypothetical protein